MVIATRDEVDIGVSVVSGAASDVGDGSSMEVCDRIGEEEGVIGSGVVGIAAEAMIEEEIASASVTGQMVVVSAIVSVTTPPFVVLAPVV